MPNRSEYSWQPLPALLETLHRLSHQLWVARQVPISRRYAAVSEERGQGREPPLDVAVRAVPLEQSLGCQAMPEVMQLGRVPIC